MIALLLFLVLVAAPARAADGQPRIVEIDSAPDDSTLEMVITDPDSSLDAGDVTVMVDGTEVPARVTALPGRKLDIVVATGPEVVSAERSALQGALIEFALRVLPTARLAIDSAARTAFVSEPSAAVAAVRDLPSETSPDTVVDDAVTARAAGEDGDRALIVMGARNELREALGGRRAQLGEGDVTVFPIVVDDATEAPQLERIAGASGGRTLMVDQAAELTGALDRVAEDLMNRYRVRASLPEDFAATGQQVQIATPTGVSDVMPVSFQQPAPAGADSAQSSTTVTDTPRSNAAGELFGAGNLLAVVGFSLIPVIGLLMAGFLTMRGRRAVRASKAPAAVVIDAVADDRRAAQEALDLLTSASQAHDRHAGLVRTAEAVASAALDGVDITLEGFLVDRATGVDEMASQHIRQVLDAMDEGWAFVMKQEQWPTDTPRRVAKLLEHGGGPISPFTVEDERTATLSAVALEHAALAREPNAEQVARLVTTLRIAHVADLVSPCTALSRAIASDVERYRDALGVAAREPVDWQRVMLGLVAEEARRSARVLQDIAALREQWLGHLDLSARGRFPAFVDSLFEQPLVTAKHVASGMDISHQGALNLIRRAEKRGWLVDYGRFGRGGRRHWIAQAVVDALGGATAE